MLLQGQEAQASLGLTEAQDQQGLMEAQAQQGQVQAQQKHRLRGRRRRGLCCPQELKRCRLGLLLPVLLHCPGRRHCGAREWCRLLGT